jgi:hypothetical protein
MDQYLLDNVKEKGIVLMINNMMKEIEYTQYIQKIIKMIKTLIIYNSEYFRIWKKSGDNWDQFSYNFSKIVRTKENDIMIEQIFTKNIENMLDVQIKCKKINRGWYKSYEIIIYFDMKDDQSLIFQCYNYKVGVHPTNKQKAKKLNNFLYIFNKLNKLS